MMWATSPVCTELEMTVMDWLGKMINIPSDFLFESGKGGGGIIQGTASESVLVSLVAARARATIRHSLDNSEVQSKLVGYISDQTHSSVQKAFIISGIPPENLHIVKTGADLRMDTLLLRSTIEEDRAKGLIPFFLCCTSGTTSTCAFDPLSELGDICKEFEMWMHVDAAYAGSAMICPEYRHLINGVEKADSFNFNPHKWLLVNFDCSAYWVKDTKSLINALSITPEYLKNKSSESGLVVDYRDWQVPLGRRFRSLKLWIVLRSYGVKQLQAYIKSHIGMAKQLEELILKDGRLTVAYKRELALITVYLKAGNEQTRYLYEKINSSRTYFVSHTLVNGLFLIRICIGSVNTKSEHVSNLWDHIQKCLDEIK